MGKGENAGYQHFLLFPTTFPKAFFLRVFKNWEFLVKSKDAFRSSTAGILIMKDLTKHYNSLGGVFCSVLERLSCDLHI